MHPLLPHLTAKSLIFNFIPRIFIQPNGHQRVFHGFVDQRVDTGDEEVYGPQQGFTVPTQQLLRFCIIPKLILWRETQVLPAGCTLMRRRSEVLLTCNSGDFWLRSVKVSPRACCVCTILWKWLMSAVANLKMFSYLLLVSFNNSIWASSSRSTVRDPRPNLSENICFVHCEEDITWSPKTHNGKQTKANQLLSQRLVSQE